MFVGEGKDRLMELVEDVYDLIFNTALGMLRLSYRLPGDNISIAISALLFSVVNDWEKGKEISAQTIQSAYNFCAVYQDLLDSEGMKIEDGNVVSKI